MTFYRGENVRYFHCTVDFKISRKRIVLSRRQNKLIKLVVVGLILTVGLFGVDSTDDRVFVRSGVYYRVLGPSTANYTNTERPYRLSVTCLFLIYDYGSDISA